MGRQSKAVTVSFCVFAVVAVTWRWLASAGLGGIEEGVYPVERSAGKGESRELRASSGNALGLQGAQRAFVLADSPIAAVSNAQHRIEARFVSIDSQDPRPGLSVLLERGWPPQRAQRVAEGITDDLGEVAWSGVGPGRYMVRCLGLGAWLFEIEEDELVESLHVELFRSHWVTGDARDHDGNALPGASIWISDASNRSVGDIVAVTDGAGRFRFELAEGGKRWISGFAEGYQAAPLSVVSVNADMEPVEVRLGPDGLDVVGRVLDLGGAGVPGAYVGLTQHPMRDVVAQGRRQVELPKLHATTDPDGCFEFTGVARTRIRLNVTCEGYAGNMVDLDPPRMESGPVDVVLSPSASLTGVVLGRGGSRLVGAKVSVGAVGSAMYAHAFCEADGGFLLPGLPMEDVPVRITANGCRPLIAIARWDGDGWSDFRVELELRGDHDLCGTITPLTYSADASWLVAAECRDNGGQRLVESGIAVNGEFRFESWPNVETWISVYPEGSMGVSIFSVGPVRPDQGRIKVQVPKSGLKSCQVFAGLNASWDKQGQLSIRRRGSTKLYPFVFDRRANAHGISVPAFGEWVVEARDRKLRLLHSEVICLDGESRYDLGMIPGGEAGFLVVGRSAMDRERPPRRLSVITGEGSEAATCVIDAGATTLSLAPGEYTVSSDSPDMGVWSSRMIIEEGVSSEVILPPPITGAVEVNLDCSRLSSSSAVCRLEFYGENEALVGVRYFAPRVGGDDFAVWLAVGSYRLKYYVGGASGLQDAEEVYLEVREGEKKRVQL